MDVKQLIENAKLLSPKERAFIAQCLISSLETKQDDYVDNAWADIAQKRYDEISNGEVNPVTWEEIKKAIKG